MKILVSWSTGKDSAWMLHVLNQQHPGAAAGLLTTTNQAFDRVAMHAVRREMVEAQARAVDLPLHIVPLPWPCSNEQYEAIMKDAVAGFVHQGFTHVAFGDLFLEDVRDYRITRLAGSGLEPLFPIWKTKSTRELAEEMIASGLKSRLTCVNPKRLDASFCGRVFDRSFLDDLPAAVDPCGENGEFHSFAFEGPMFRHPVNHQLGEIVERDGYVFADVLPNAYRLSH
jgi:uncharacterized protein (TIGR00290 family)